MPTPAPTTLQQLADLSTFLASRRGDILDDWRSRVAADPSLTTGASLPAVQLRDHLPALLEDFERRLVVASRSQQAAAAQDQEGDAAAHGLHRWQQGFDLNEVTRELGRLNECVVVELDRCAALLPDVSADTLAEARRIWAALHSTVVSASASQYFLLRQIEARGHVNDLERALESMKELESQRAELWQQAAHDLRGNLGAVVMATAGLTSGKGSQELQTRFLNSLDRNAQALHRLLEDVTSLARLQGGQEIRSLAPADFAVLIHDLCEGLRTLAEDKGLSLTCAGPAPFFHIGDAIKTRRILQNLLINAIKYTDSGGIELSWGDSGPDEGPRWFVQVKDTGPGFDMGPRTALAGALGVATGQAKDVAAARVSGAVTHVAPADGVTAPAAPGKRGSHASGEGIGLSIVKRLCELLNATLEVDSRAGEGTMFRLLFPNSYD